MSDIKIGDRVQWQERTPTRRYLHTLEGQVVSLSDVSATIFCDGLLHAVMLHKLEKVEAEPVMSHKEIADDDPYGITAMFSVKPGAFDDIAPQAPIGIIRHPATKEVLFDTSERLRTMEAGTL